MLRVHIELTRTEKIIKHFGGLSSLLKNFFYPIKLPKNNTLYLLNKNSYGFCRQFRVSLYNKAQWNIYGS